MANDEQLAIFSQGIEAWNQWRESNPDIRPDLRGAILSEVDLEDWTPLFGIDLSKANLVGADLRGVYLSEANLYAAKLTGADLSDAKLTRAYFGAARLTEATICRADLVGANFAGADLSLADLSQARLHGADFVETELTGARLVGADVSAAEAIGVTMSGANFIEAHLDDLDFTDATVGWTTFGSVDLSRVTGLDTVQHLAPSYIDVDTLYRSRGDIPEIFLQGAGIPDRVIKSMHSIVKSERAIDHYSCFISYSSGDQAFAKRLRADLQANAVRCWFAPEDMRIGDKIRPTLDRSIRVHDKLMIILSENSIGSNWVEQEVETALDRERQEGRIVLFPIRLDDTVMDIEVGWPALIRNTRHIGDFRNWKDHDAYQQAFGRLLRDLKAEDAGS